MRERSLPWRSAVWARNETPGKESMVVNHVNLFISVVSRSRKNLLQDWLDLTYKHANGTLFEIHGG